MANFQQNTVRAAAFLISTALLLGQPAMPRRHEVGLTLRSLMGVDRASPGGTVGLGNGVAFQANYGYRLFDAGKAQFFGEVHFLANPLREITSQDPGASRDVATLYVVPGLRVKFLAGRTLSPYAAIGAGYALYEQSLFQISGAPNTAPRFTHRGALSFGAGADFPVWRFISGRFEVRDFYTGNPAFNTALSGGGQHNVVVGGGFVLRFGEPYK